MAKAKTLKSKTKTKTKPVKASPAKKSAKPAAKAKPAPKAKPAAKAKASAKKPVAKAKPARAKPAPSVEVEDVDEAVEAGELETGYEVETEEPEPVDPHNEDSGDGNNGSTESDGWREPSPVPEPVNEPVEPEGDRDELEDDEMS